MADAVRTLRAALTSTLCAIPDVCTMPVSESLPCGERDGLVTAQAFALLRAIRSLTRSNGVIFVPHDAPEPTEWLQSHPDHIKLPATFVPGAGSDGRTNPSSGSPPPGQRGTVDGLAPPPNPTAPWRPTENAVSNATQAGTNESSDRTFIGADPIAAYCRANEALATAAGRHVSEHAVASNPSADVGNAPADRTTPLSSLAEQVASAIWHAIIPPAEAKEDLPAQAVHQQLQPEFENFFNRLYGPALKIAKDLNIPVEFVLGVAALESEYYSDRHDIGLSNPWGSTQAGRNDLRFGSVEDAATYWEKSNAWREVDPIHWTGNGVS